jgi:hypothetical protein
MRPAPRYLRTASPRGGGNVPLRVTALDPTRRATTCVPVRRLFACDSVAVPIQFPGVAGLSYMQRRLACGPDRGAVRV